MSNPELFTPHGPFGALPYGGAWGVFPLVDLDSSRVFQTTLIVSQPTYGQVQLSWAQPGGDWDGIALVRNSWGVPVTKDAGVTLDERSVALNNFVTAPSFNSLLDTRLPQGDIYYYGLFVHTTDDEPRWVRAAGAWAVVIKDHGFLDLLYDSLPAVHRRHDTTQDLRQFLSLFAFELDTTRTLLETAAKANDLQNVHASLLPLWARQLAVDYEPAVGDHRMRLFLENVLLLRKVKGTTDGVAAFCETLTGFAATVVVGKNLLLDPTDSNFEGGTTGNWGCYGSADDLYWSNAAPGDRDSDGTGYAVVRSSPFGPGNNMVILQYFPVTELLDLFLSVAREIGRGRGVPVTAGEDYTVSAYVRAAVNPREFKAVMVWTDAEGLLLPVDFDPTPAGHDTDSTTDWNTRVWATATAPVEAHYLYPAFLTDDPSVVGVDEEHYFDQIQVEVGTTPTTFEPARQLHIYLAPTRENLVTNPSFEVDDAGWLGNGASFVVDAGAADSGTQSALVTVTGVSGPASIFIILPVEEGLPYSAAASAMELDGLGPLMLAMQFLDSGFATVGPTVTTEAQGVLDAWRKMKLSTTAPDTAAYVALGVGYLDATGLTGNTFRVDSVLFEQAYDTGHYFDGDSPTTSDEYGWVGTPHDSKSLYYRNRAARDVVLARNLPSWVPAASSFDLVYWEDPP